MFLHFDTKENVKTVNNVLVEIKKVLTFDTEKLIKPDMFCDSIFSLPIEK